MLAIKLFAASLVSILSTPAWAQVAGDPARGSAVAQKTCASCHGVMSTDLSSPKPKPITFKEVADTPGMTGIAINVWLQTPHRSMPDFIIAPQDRADVIAYIVSLRDQPQTK